MSSRATLLPLCSCPEYMRRVISLRLGASSLLCSTMVRKGCRRPIARHWLASGRRAPSRSACGGQEEEQAGGCCQHCRCKRAGVTAHAADELLSTMGGGMAVS